MKLLLKILLPLVVIAVSIWFSQRLIAGKPEPERRSAPAEIPLVEVVRLQPQDYQIYIDTQGTVQPRTESTLIPEVSGRIVEVSPKFHEGSFFEKGDALLRIDPRDYEIAVTIAKAQVSQANAALEEEKARGLVAERELKQSQRKPASMSMALRKPQLEAAQSALASAEAQLAQAQLNLERTAITAPYAGRVLEKNVDIGQYVSGGTVLAKIYAIDYVEIPLPLSNQQLEHVSLPAQFRDQAMSPQSGPTVTLTSNVGEQQYQWQGVIVRATGAIDTQSRQLFVIAQIDDPYAQGPDARPPLRIGKFVEARIQGRLLRDVFVLPRATLYQGNEVIIVDTEQRLQRRELNIVWSDADHVVVSEGLQAGELLATTSMPTAISGTQVTASVGGEAASEQRHGRERRELAERGENKQDGADKSTQTMSQ